MKFLRYIRISRIQWQAQKGRSPIQSDADSNCSTLIKSDGSFIFFLLQKSWNAMRIFSLAMQISKRAIASQKFSTLHRFLEYMLYVEVICTFGQLLAIEEISID